MRYFVFFQSFLIAFFREENVDNINSLCFNDITNECVNDITNECVNDITNECVNDITIYVLMISIIMVASLQNVFPNIVSIVQAGHIC